jgi:formylmethanofuran dehydrogenase subunit D
MSISGMLITVRTLKQGAAMEKGKLDNEEYLKEISTVTLNSEELDSLGLGEDKQALLKTAAGEVKVYCRPGEGIGKGQFFMPLGHVANSVTWAETQGTGVPDFKGVDATLSPV